MEDFEPDNTKVKLFRKNLPHNCDDSLNRVYKVSDAVKRMIEEYHESGLTMKNILFNMRGKTDIIQPTKQQVKSVLQNYRNRVFGNSAITLSDMQKFAEENMAVPVDEDDGFVVAFERSNSTEVEASKRYFRIFYSTPRLLKNATNGQIIHADGTYKNVVQGFPLLVVGFSDLHKHFHLSGIAICSSESTDDYAFLFNALKHGIALVTEQRLRLIALVSDAAPAIENGFQRAFDDDTIVHINCFAHLMRNVEKRKLKDPMNKEKIKNDIRQLQKSSNQHVFNVGSELFINKWSEHEDEFATYFKNTYITRNNKWFMGSVYRAPKTNNCLENFNNQVKQHHTFWKRRVLSEFKVRALRIVALTSKEYVQDRKPFQQVISIGAKLMSTGLSYSESDKLMTRTSEQDGFTLLYMCAGEKNERPRSAEINGFNTPVATTFDAFVEGAFSIHKVSFKNEVSKWKESICSCPYYAKEYMCKHVIGIAYRLNILSKPEESVEQPIASKNPPGRPKKPKKALIRE